MEFQIPKHITMERRVGNARRIEAEVADGLRDRATGRVAPLQYPRVKPAYQRQTAQKRNPETDTLLLRERDDFDAEPEAPPAQLLDERETKHDAEHAIVGARIRHGIDM